MSSGIDRTGHWKGRPGRGPDHVAQGRQSRGGRPRPSAGSGKPPPRTFDHKTCRGDLGRAAFFPLSPPQRETRRSGAWERTENPEVRNEAVPRRCRHGSNPFFWRAAADGLLLPVRRGRSVLYRLAEVFAFEGGPPLAGWDAAYRVDLMLPEEVGAQVARGRDWVLDRARSGELPCRRVGSQVRFQPAEVARWQESWA